MRPSLSPRMVSSVGWIRTIRSLQPIQTTDSFSFLASASVAQCRIKPPWARPKSFCSRLRSGCSLDGHGPSGAPLAVGDVLGTGCVLTPSKERVVVSQAFFPLMGDLDGNGLVSATDALLAPQSSVGLTSLSDISAAVADCDWQRQRGCKRCPAHAAIFGGTDSPNLTIPKRMLRSS